MTAALIPWIYGLAFTLLFAAIVSGWSMARADTLKDWDVADIALLRDASARRTRQGPLDRLAQFWSPSLGRLLGPRLTGKIRHRIDLAGRPDGLTLDSFLQVLVKYALFLGAASLALLSMGRYLSAVAILTGIYLLPMSRISGHQRRRREQIDNDLPDLLDILAVTVGAGIGFRSALDRVSSRFQGPLRSEIVQTLRELDVGVPRRQAFIGLRERSDSDAMSSFVSAFLQAEELGAPLGESLTQIAGDSRREASQRARRRAARMVPRVTLIVSIGLVPPTVLVIVVGLYVGSGLNIGDILNG